MLTAPENKKHTSLEINCMIKSKNSHFTKINDGFSQILTEAEEAFAAEGIQMLGKEPLPLGEVILIEKSY